MGHALCTHTFHFDSLSPVDCFLDGRPFFSSSSRWKDRAFEPACRRPRIYVDICVCSRASAILHDERVLFFFSRFNFYGSERLECFRRTFRYGGHYWHTTVLLVLPFFFFFLGAFMIFMNLLKRNV